MKIQQQRYTLLTVTLKTLTDYIAVCSISAVLYLGQNSVHLGQNSIYLEQTFRSLI